MASLLELALFQEQTISTPSDPGEPPDPAKVAANAEIVAANDYFRRVRMLVSKRSVAFMRATPNPSGQKQLENLAFAQQFLKSPRPHLDSVLTFILAQAPPAHSIAQIIGVDDTELNNQITNADLQLLASGLVPGQ